MFRMLPVGMAGGVRVQVGATAAVFGGATSLGPPIIRFAAAVAETGKPPKFAICTASKDIGADRSSTNH